MGRPANTMSVPDVTGAEAPATGEVLTTDADVVNWHDLV